MHPTQAIKKGLLWPTKKQKAQMVLTSVSLLCGQATWVHLSERSLNLIGFHVLALRRPLFQSSAGAPQPP